MPDSVISWSSAEHKQYHFDKRDSSTKKDIVRFQALKGMIIQMAQNQLISAPDCVYVHLDRVPRWRLSVYGYCYRNSM